MHTFFNQYSRILRTSTRTSNSRYNENAGKRDEQEDRQIMEIGQKILHDAGVRVCLSRPLSVFPPEPMTSDVDVRGARRYRGDTRVEPRVHGPRALMLACPRRPETLGFLSARS